LESHLHLQSLIDYFATHAGLALGAVFAASLLESVALVGTILPGSTIVFAGGMLIGLKALDPWAVGAAAVVGAVVGDGLSYWLGHRYRAVIRTTWPVRKHPALFERGEAYFAAHGGKSVFLGRFLGPLRAIVPVVAGMSNMPAVQFYTMNVLSAVGWAAAHLIPGALFGASLQLAGAVSARLVALIALIAVAAWTVALLIRVVVKFGWPYVRLLQDRIVVHARRRPGWLGNLVLPLVDPARGESVSLLVAATALIGGAWLFLGVVEDVVTQDTLVQVDRSIYEGLQAVRTGWVDDIMVTITALGSAYVTIAVIVAVALWLGILRRWRTLAYWIAAVVFAELLVSMLKYGLERQRPDTPYAGVDPYSFPSGHAALSIVVYGFLAFLVAHGKPGWQRVVVALPAVSIAVLIAFSRLYLGAHWFSDVMASLGLGLAWIGLLCIAYINHVHEKPLRTLPMSIVVFTTLAFFGTAYAHRNHERDLARYAKPVTNRTLAFDAWRDGEWRSLPAARSELRGQREEPFTLQWAGSAARITGALEAARWRAPAPWDASGAFLWLIPATPIDKLPVVPKLHQGQPPGLTFVQPVDATNRRVLRLWHVADVVDGEAMTPRPLWAGIVTTEQMRTELGLVATARTTYDVAPDAPALQASLRSAGLNAVAQTQDGRSVLLVW
jgi:undecaprenyl-diphosphatase